MSATNKLKIFNDPIYGFITIPSEFIFDLLEQPYFQRLRHISQLGLTYLVYPGAYHTRFHHALGAMHLARQAILSLRQKEQSITPEEEEAVLIAILLHDIGHGPFSHALEKELIPGHSHESLSVDFMEILNQQWPGRLDLALEIFQDRYPRKFLHQLIASQLDMDRLDYLRRDCFYTGVSEGRVNADRLITMLSVANDQLVVEAKGIYSVEKFLVARRLMYWQVYLHKTVLSAEFLLLQILRRAREVYREELPCPSVLRPFLRGDLPQDHGELIQLYARLDDHDLLAAIKEWEGHPDALLANLCQRLLHRRLLGVQSCRREPTTEQLEELVHHTAIHLGLSKTEARYLVFVKKISNNAYDPERDRINLLYKSGELVDIAEAADQLNISALSRPVVKYFLFAPKPVLQAHGSTFS